MPTSLTTRSLLAGAALFACVPILHAEVVKIGFIEVLSGPFANTGKSSLNQLREVVTQLNAKSRASDPKFEVVPFDGKGSPQESTTALKAAVDQGIHYITQGGGSGADTVITSNWGSDLTLLFKSAKEFGLNINFFTLNANNTGTPAQLGSWGTEKVGVIWNWGHNAPTPELEKIYLAYKSKFNEDFIFAAHWNSMNMLAAAMQQTKSIEPKKVAYALEGMKYKSPMGEVEMRKTDHQLLAPLFLGIWAKQGSKGVKYDAEKTGYGFRSEVVWDSYVSAQPTSCQMNRP